MKKILLCLSLILILLLIACNGEETPLADTHSTDATAEKPLSSDAETNADTEADTHIGTLYYYGRDLIKDCGIKYFLDLAGYFVFFRKCFT